MTRSRLLALIVKSLSQIRFLVWRFTGEPAGAHAVPISRGGKVILVKLTYAGGWRLPGGAVRRGEDPVKAVERELREEIGMVEHGGVHSEHNLTPATASRPAGGYVFLFGTSTTGQGGHGDCRRAGVRAR
jgi:8-oxo-dGTP pyrophosphatase MutT (NUDIX family)